MKKQTNPSLTKLADAAFKQATAKVIARAKASGTPLIIWENHEVKAVDPQEFEGRGKKRGPRKASQ